jgi:predicted PurR-regulated permease PerM
MTQKLTFDRFFRWMLGLLVFLGIGYLMQRFSTLVLFFVLSLAFSYILTPIVNRLEAKGMARVWSVTLVVTLLIGGLIWAATSLVPLVGEQLVGFATAFNLDTIRLIVRQINDAYLPSLPFIGAVSIERYVIDLLEEYFVSGDVSSTISGLVGLFTNLFTAVLIIPVATFFLLKDGFLLRRNLLRIVPNKYFETSLVILDKIESRLIIYFSSVLLQSSIVGLLSFIFLSIVGLENALLVAIIIGLANSIPYFGPLIGYVLAIVVSIYETGSVDLVPHSLFAILGVQIIDNVLLQPLIFSKSADLHPIYILFVVLIGAELAGVLGMLLAIPVVTVVRITVTEIRWSLQNYHVFNLD